MPTSLTHEEIQQKLDAFLEETKKTSSWELDLKLSPSAVELLALPPKEQIRVFDVILTRWGQCTKEKFAKEGSRVEKLQEALLRRSLPYTTADMETLLSRIATLLSDMARAMSHYYNPGMTRFLRWVEKYAETTPLSETMIVSLGTIEKHLKDYSPSDRKLKARIAGLIGSSEPMGPDAGETWSDKAIAEIQAMPHDVQQVWSGLFAYLLTADGSKPTTAWLKEARKHIAGIGETEFYRTVVGWFSAVTAPPLVTKEHEYNGRTWTTQEQGGTDKNITLLKGLAWCCVERTEPEVTRALAKLIENTVKKVPGVGPWAVRAMSAGIYALSTISTNEAVGQLSRLRMKVTFRTALNQIEKALETAAERAGMPRADLEDLGVPTSGFAADGTRQETFGDGSVLAKIESNGDISVQWTGANGKPVKSVPASVKKDHADDVKEFKADVDAAKKMLTAQKARFETFFLPERVWKLGDWRERYAEHPILSHIVHRLIWQFTVGESRVAGLWNAERNAFVDERGHVLDNLTDETEMRLWHPLFSDTDTVIRWRNYLLEFEIIQPFKQAYREVYLLTAAEERTATYSNRFAGHILKQHQMNQLAAQRGWQNSLRLMVDDSYPPATKELPDFNLRAEFWVEGVGENYGTDTTDSGTYLYLTTDQVRFYRLDAAPNYAHAGGGGYESDWRWRNVPRPEPVPLSEIPPLVFSEIMREVDLFVGVSSVGNDPTWQDGGPNGRHRDYWQDYSFGDLSETAKTRKAVLEKLLPRLKIASRATLTDKFLVVKGELRTYKIHLGSGNILMEPNDQYLCIVQDRSDSGDGTKFLPFEGDSRLSLILSKAFLLADDKKITDVTITRQICP